ncbi:MAG: carbamoyl-phosphate synthase large subunit [Chthonomonadaceae bacterium]|nr:carbamoyl-phosphate synthase large subunit [Chthonomonadaceae bacterium]
MGSTVIVLGSGPIRIGQGIEFDYSCVHCVWALRQLGHRAVIINNNPETVSTDFDTADALYFEPLTLESVFDIFRHEKAEGVVVQFGGQTGINLAHQLEELGVPILGTSPRAITETEDRGKFDALLGRLGLARPAGSAVRSYEDAYEAAEKVGYPVLVRPSFVLGGRAMDIVFDAQSLKSYYSEAEAANPGQPVLVDKYLEGSEVEIDVVADGETALVPGIMEHIERAGVHSGDSIAVYPPVGLNRIVEGEIVSIGVSIAKELSVKGLMNIQFVVQNDKVSVIEVNPRASRTVPYLSKVTGVPMVKLATAALMGHSLSEMGYGTGLWCREGKGGRAIDATEYARGTVNQSPLFAVKAPVFSFQKLSKVEPSLGPEMKSTGEVLGLDFQFEAALYKALVASGVTFKSKGQVIISVADGDKPAAVRVAREFSNRGYSLAATGGTHDVLSAAGITAERLNKIKEGSPNLLERLFEGRVSLMINTPGPAASATVDAGRIRRACIETGVACVTSIDTAWALAQTLDLFEDPSKTSCLSLSEYLEREPSREAMEAAPTAR